GFLFLSGATLPLAMLPNFVQIGALFLPATYLVNGLQLALAESISLTALLPATISLLGTTVIAFALSVQLFRWDPSEKASRKSKLWALSAIIPFLLLGTWEALWHGDLRESSQTVYSYLEHGSPQKEAPH
ncbi:MAG TPA: ABC transporter permease, partial [Candidatus Limnocylindrales bacterium]|nr:ABC transporter permease [Candidatus Limnocylindrales bacterium]